MTQKQRFLEMGITKFLEYVEKLEMDREYWFNRWYWGNQDCDGKTLEELWGVCARTLYNYRQQGLEHYRKGRKYYYTSDARKKFLKERR
ncbi:helix-turn-helix domain-containing protein [Prolixibacteraceae bacterium Z1-6]|uniref:Helix-turn-helix domain-containing protein n=1 Tax=Draconibacterium aestuarii TaxID=2998507 RepID=A0A9X3FD54_9BACT|nr:helix-turn-helix domain-containing protein [Prolixibacteraceae bacterium Z1-6]